MLDRGALSALTPPLPRDEPPAGAITPPTGRSWPAVVPEGDRPTAHPHLALTDECERPLRLLAGFRHGRPAALIGGEDSDPVKTLPTRPERARGGSGSGARIWLKGGADAALPQAAARQLKTLAGCYVPG